MGEGAVCVDGDDGDVVAWPSEILGCPVVVERRSTSQACGLRVSCCNPAHPTCNKYRSIRKDIAAFGHDAPVHFLETWQAEAFNLDEADHRRFRLTRQQIRDHLASAQDE